MSHHVSTDNTSAKPQNGTATPSAEERLLTSVRESLDAGQPRAALSSLAKIRHGSENVSNLRAVCFLRLGDANAALGILRPMVLGSAISLKPSVPIHLAVNFATALLLEGNLSGCLGVLQEIHNEEDPGVQQLRAAIKKWRDRQSFWSRVNLALGNEPSQPVQLDFPPGRIGVAER